MIVNIAVSAWQEWGGGRGRQTPSITQKTPTNIPKTSNRSALISVLCCYSISGPQVTCKEIKEKLTQETTKINATKSIPYSFIYSCIESKSEKNIKFNMNYMISYKVKERHLRYMLTPKLVI